MNQNFRKIYGAFACVLSLLSFTGSSRGGAADEAEFYEMVTIPIPEGIVLEAGAMQMMPNGRFFVSTRFGEIYVVEGAFGNPPRDVGFRLFASGLHEVLGLAWRDGWLYATQRGEVTRLRDENGDGKADRFETVNDEWGMTGDYHEYAFGSKFDKNGDIWVVLCLTGSFTSDALYRGWCLRVSPSGKMIPTCSGLRSPGGIGMNALGEVFYTDNQGPWNGTSSLKQLVPGSFMGHPAGNRWYAQADGLGSPPAEPVSGSRMHIEAKRIPQLIPPAVYFPYNKMGQSASGIACDLSEGKFGPFKGQLFVGDQTHSTVMRVFLEKIKGRYQGACFPFRQGFASGTLSLEFAPDGSLFVGGTDRGWGARGGKPFALQRLIWSGQTPFEILEMRACADGFELSFTEPVDRLSAEKPDNYRMKTYTHIYQSNYGSPEVDQEVPTFRGITAADDGMRVRIILDRMREGHVHELHLPGLRSARGRALLHAVAYYTLNATP